MNYMIPLGPLPSSDRLAQLVYQRNRERDRETETERETERERGINYMITCHIFRQISPASIPKKQRERQRQRNRKRERESHRTDKHKKREIN